MNKREPGMNNDGELQRAIKRYYRTKSLSPDRVQFLIQAKTQAMAPRRRSRVMHRMPLMALAAACAVFLFLWIVQEQQQTTEQAVCAEVVMNYQKHSPMQVLSSHYADVQAGLNRLDFSIMPANARILQAYRLVGGRYCSIQGFPAAQMRVQDMASGKECTLYAIKAVGVLHNVNSTIDRVGGVRVEVWRQDDVLFALAEPAD